MDELDKFAQEGLRRQALARLSRQKGVLRKDMGDSEDSRMSDRRELERVQDIAAFLGADEGRSPAGLEEARDERLQPTLPEDISEDTMRQILKAKMLRDRSGR